MSAWARRVLVAGLPALLAPGAAMAHLVATGMGPVYDGVLHFALSPEDVLLVIALALFAGLRGPGHARALFWVLPPAWFAGGVLAMMNLAPAGIALSLTTAVLFLAVGGLLAANARLPMAACSAIGVVLGLSRGMADLAGVDPNSAHLLMLGGMCAAIFLVSALAASVTLPLQRLWMIVTARVCGSWIAAMGLLLAGWMVRYGAVV